MHRVELRLHVYLPTAVYHTLRGWRQRRRRVTAPRKNLVGDRDVEWSWVVSHLPSGPGHALDFGSGDSHLGLSAAQRGFAVTAIGLEPARWHYEHARLHFVQGDLLTLDLPANHFDLVLNCSTVEHVGLAGRYGVTVEREDGDLEAMGRLHLLMRESGVQLMTVPIGRDAVLAPLHRIYGLRRLPLLLRGFQVEKEEYWMKNQENRWIVSDRDTALRQEADASSWNPAENLYALGCFVLRKSRS